MAKLNWFSPLPPAKTDIAHYTQRLLPALAKVAEVTLWTDQRSWDGDLKRLARVRNYNAASLPWVELNQADMTFFQMGNDERFHGTIWQVSRRLAGVVVLHDYRLHDFFDILFRTRLGDHKTYHDVLVKYYGEQGGRDAQSGAKTRDYMAENYPLTELALENAAGVLVHTEEAFQSVIELDRWPVILAPLPFPVMERTVSRKKREQVCRLVLFGYIGRNRRLDSVLQALAQMETKDRYHLDVFGLILHDEKGLRSTIKSLKLDSCVTLHGFKPENELDRALADCDLAINLRYPTMGEASGTQLRIWSHGLPSMVSRIGWLGSLPADSVAFVRTDENEIDDIKEHLKALLEDRKRYIAMGERGRRELAEKHAPDLYARSVLEFTQQAQRFRSELANLALAERAAKIVSQWLAPDATASTFHRVATEIRALQKRD